MTLSKYWCFHVIKHYLDITNMTFPSHAMSTYRFNVCHHMRHEFIDDDHTLNEIRKVENLLMKKQKTDRHNEKCNVEIQWKWIECWINRNRKLIDRSTISTTRTRSWCHLPNEYTFVRSFWNFWKFAIVINVKLFRFLHQIKYEIANEMLCFRQGNQSSIESDNKK